MTGPSVLVAMSGGVDSSVAAALLLDGGYDVVGATLKLWGGPSDSGCCSVADVDDAARVASQLGIPHYVFAFAAEFEAGVVAPYVADHAAGRTPNPCIECNRTIKFDRLLRRADELGLDLLATGHHAQVDRVATGDAWRLRRGADAAKDQSYVLHVLGQDVLARTLLPVGGLIKAEVRERAEELGLRTAAKPDSQEVCFVPKRGRSSFLAERGAATPGRVLDTAGREVGSVAAVELVTIGQRRGLGLAGGGPPRFAVDVDVTTRTVTVGDPQDLLVDEVTLDRLSWVGGSPAGPVHAQSSAHGRPVSAQWDLASSTVRFAEPTRRVAPGQSVVLYDGDTVLGGGLAT